MLETEFLSNTIKPDVFKICNVESDNACFYRAAANYIYYAQPEKQIKTLRKLHPSIINKWGQVKDIDTVDQHYGRYSDDQDTLARALQKKILQYVKEYNKEILHETGMSIKDSIALIHDISFEEYVESYKNFAGDIDLEECLEEEGEYIDRWGSIVEQSVLSNILQCPIMVFNSQKYDKKLGKIVNGKIIKNKPEKDVRLKLSSMSGGKYMGKLPLFLIWREYHTHGHYLVCYPKDKSTINFVISDLIN